VKKTIDDFNSLCAKKSSVSEPFMFDVDKKDYPRYLSYVPFEMNVQKVIARLQGGFYRHKEVFSFFISV